MSDDTLALLDDSSELVYHAVGNGWKRGQPIVSLDELRGKPRTPSGWRSNMYVSVTRHRAVAVTIAAESGRRRVVVIDAADLAFCGEAHTDDPDHPDNPDHAGYLGALAAAAADPVVMSAVRDGPEEIADPEVVVRWVLGIAPPTPAQSEQIWSAMKRLQAAGERAHILHQRCAWRRRHPFVERVPADALVDVITVPLERFPEPPHYVDGRAPSPAATVRAFLDWQLQQADDRRRAALAAARRRQPRPTSGIEAMLRTLRA